MHIASFQSTYMPPLGSLSLKFDDRVNLFIGANACGKTTILRAMNELLKSERSVGIQCQIEASRDWPRNDEGNPESVAWNQLPHFYIPATHIHLPTAPTNTDVSEGQLGIQSGIFNGRVVEALTRSVRNLRVGGPHAIRRFVDSGYSCAKEICSEIIYDNTPHIYVSPDPQPEEDLEAETSRYAMGIGTIDDILGDPLYLGALSAGTQGTLLSIWALTLTMMLHQGGQSGWENKPAILLIDEIENHLHPTWQRRVIPALLKYFPGLQIFATTHSPFVVAGLKTGQVHLLKRNEHGGVTATTNTEDIVGWTADEILRTMMGVDDPTDDATAAAARELRQLRNEMPLTDDEAEAQRQERMQELRKKVDRDLLAGGPMAAQRERFEEDFRKALRSIGALGN